MTEAEHVSELVQGHRLEVVPTGFAAGGGRPLEARVEVDVRLEQRAGGRVEQERGRAEDPLLLGTVEEADRRSAVGLERLTAREALRAEGHGQGRQRVPGGGGAADGVGEGLGAHPGDIALGDEIADWPGGPAHRHHLSADLDPELQIGMSRAGRGHHRGDEQDGHRLAQARGHGRSLTARTSAPNAANGRTTRPGSPRPTRAAVATARTGVGTTTSVPDRGSGATR